MSLLAGRYRILSPLGAGGMGEVFLAEDTRLERRVAGTPALVIEVLSPSTRKHDREITRRLHDRAGVREYWLVDPDLHAVTVHRRTTDGAFPAAAHLTAARRDTLETPLVPGWSVTLARLFR